MTDSEYCRTLDLIRGEIDTAFESFYTELEMNQLAIEDQTIFDKLNRNAAFWNPISYSLQTTFFMTLGRIFDVHGDALSVHKLLRVTAEHPEYFSKAALRARRLTSVQGTPDWLENFLEGIWEPNTADLRILKKAVAPYQAKFEAVHRPIRNNVYGHNIITEEQLRHDMFESAKIKEIEEILYFLHDLVENLWNLLMNGDRPELGKVNYGYEERVRNNVRAVLSSLA